MTAVIRFCEGEVTPGSMFNCIGHAHSWQCQNAYKTCGTFCLFYINFTVIVNILNEIEITMGNLFKIIPDFYRLLQVAPVALLLSDIVINNNSY